jgi:vitamin B12 transporter
MACFSPRHSLDRLSFIRAVLCAGCLVLVPWFVLAQPAEQAIAQPAASIAGLVVDASGGALPGARIVVRDATGAGVFTTIADNLGAFALPRLAAGRYVVHVEAALFQPAAQRLDVAGAAAVPALRIALTPLGYSEHVVVTGRRTEARLAETPQKIDVIDATDLERSVAADITDALKKNAAVDVVQYSGVLSGIGIRGFRPETSGINKRSLLLVNGRPSGVTNLGMLRLDNIDRIEVLKGPASSVYGASAMGGVVNVITKPSHKNLAGTATLGLGSFNTSDLGGTLGGGVGSHFDVDVTGNMYDQRADFRMGDGVVRPATTYKTYDGTVRLGADLSSTWRIEGTANGYRGRDIMTPGDVFTGTTSQGRKDLERSAQEVRLSGAVGAHALSGTAYRTAEAGHTSNVATTNPLDQPFLPYLTFENEFGWRGLQLRDAWRWRGTSSLVFGLDYEHVESVSRSYARTGARQAPFSADNAKDTVGIFAENTWKLRANRTVISVGGRLDRITVETVDTPFKTNFTPSGTTFSVFNPSVGIKEQIVESLRVHATAGRAFVPADAIALTGYTQTTVGGRVQITQGNPDLKPERSVSFDAGLEWTDRATRIDVTYFQTTVSNRVVSNVLVSNPPAPDPIVLSYANALGADIRGIEVDVERRLTPRVGVFSSATHFFERTQELATGTQNMLNVAKNTVRLGVDVDMGRLSARLFARYVQGRQDNDFNLAGSPIVDYPAFCVVDLAATYRLAGRHAVVLTVSNLLDAHYYEKKGYPLAGASFVVKYRVGF